MIAFLCFSERICGAIYIKEFAVFRFTTYDAQTQGYKTTLQTDDGEYQRLDNNIIFSVALNEVYDVVEDEPLSAKVTVETNTRIARKESGTKERAELFDTLVNTKSVFSADEYNFFSDCRVKAFSDDELVFHQQWKKVIPRFNA